MLHILRQAATPDGQRVLRTMFAARKSVFVDLLKWDVPVIDGAFEIDQFDDIHATYLVLTDPAGTHLASARLLPTDRPHILDSLYPDLCQGRSPRDPTIFEITRFCLDRRLPAGARRIARNRLVVALVDHALDSGITGYCAIAELSWLQQILAFGWSCRPLGPPRSVDGRMLGAIAIAIDATTPAKLVNGGIIAAADPLRMRSALAA